MKTNSILDRPIQWKDHEKNPEIKALLTDLQANILKAHGRDHSAHIFLSFSDASPKDACKACQVLSKNATSALMQLEATDHYRATQRNSSRYPSQVVCFFLSKSGYERLGFDKELNDFADEAFKKGMQASKAKLFDPDPEEWDASLGGGEEEEEEEKARNIDAMLLIADVSAEAVAIAVAGAKKDLQATKVKIVGVEIGLQKKRKIAGEWEGIENFGYVDGRSQPLFLAETLAEETDKENWNPGFPPSQFIVADPLNKSSYGSYFVFRKLEQDVKGFKDREKALAKSIGLTGCDEERAGALIVGRFEDGTPVVSFKKEQKKKPPNDFNYKNDDDLRCPFQAHIRKMNPRLDDAQSRSPIMARRGITYGARVQNEDGEFLDQPRGGCGLLFMAYMASIVDQFEVTQAGMANSDDFPPGRGLVAIDPIIGQGPGKSDVAWFDGWSGKKSRSAFCFRDFVTMKGGEYFFAPSISFLCSLASAKV